MKGSVLAEEIDEQYNLDGLEKSVGLAKDNNLSRELIDMIKEAHIFLTELELQLQTSDDYRRLYDDLEGLIASLVEACKYGEQIRAKETVVSIKDKLDNFNLYLGIEKARDLINGNTYTLISTAGKNGKVDIAFVGSAAIIKDKHLIVARMLLGRTVDNLKENKNAVVIGYKINEKNAMDSKIARIYCTLVAEVREGPLFDQVKHKVTKEEGFTAAGMIKSLLVFDINEIRAGFPIFGRPWLKTFCASYWRPLADKL